MKTKRRIWIASEYYYPIGISTGYYITEIAEYLASQGMGVNVVCTGYGYNDTIKHKLKSEETHNGVHIYRVCAKGGVNKNNFFKRASRLFFTSLRIFLKLLFKTNRDDLLLVVTNPAFLLLLIPVIKKIKKIKCFLLVHDIFPENLVAINKIKKESRIYSILSKLFNKAYSSFDVHISIGRDMTNVIEGKIKSKDTIALITNWADNKEVFPIKKNETKLYNDLELHDKFIFQFAGNLGHTQGLDTILRSAELIENSKVHFLFIGSGAKYEMIKDFSESHANTSLLGFKDRSEQNDFLNTCDVAIITLCDGMYGLGVPSKSYNIMAAGKPILMIGPPDSEIAQCVRVYNLGWIVEPNNPEALKDVLEHIYEQRNNLAQIQNNSRRVADTVFAKEIVLHKYYQLLNDI